MDNIFDRKRQQEVLPDGVRRMFDRIMDVLNDDDKQNATRPEEIQKIFLREGNFDESIAENINFGLFPALPIPVNGPLGEITYLSKLKTKATGSRIFFHRLGSIKQEPFGNLDVYECVSWDGAVWDILYFDCYHAKKNKKIKNLYMHSGANSSIM
jgi:hypothetical protein